MNFTLDTNCIIDLEDQRENAPFVRDLVALHGRSGINIAISAIGASERRRDGGYASSFAEFKTKLEGVGLGAAQLLKPRGYWGITFYDFFLWVATTDPLEQKIHEILFPDKEFLWEDYARARGLAPANLARAWRNAKCDVLALWCHIHYGGEVFVTSDDNFHALTKIDTLQAMGAGKIVYPKDALSFATASLSVTIAR